MVKTIIPIYLAAGGKIVKDYSFSAQLVEDWKNAVYTIRKAQVEVFIKWKIS